MKKQIGLLSMALMMSLVGTGSSDGRTRITELSVETAEERRKRYAANKDATSKGKGLNKFIYQCGATIWATNKKNADRKYKNLISKNND